MNFCFVFLQLPKDARWGFPGITPTFSLFIEFFSIKNISVFFACHTPTCHKILHLKFFVLFKIGQMIDVSIHSLKYQLEMFLFSVWNVILINIWWNKCSQHKFSIKRLFKNFVKCHWLLLMSEFLGKFD